MEEGEVSSGFDRSFELRRRERGGDTHAAYTVLYVHRMCTTYLVSVGRGG